MDRSRLSPTLPVSLALAVLASPLTAATFTWDGEGAGDRWDLNTKWVGDTTPTFNNTADIIFHTSGAGTLDSNIGVTDKTIRSITFNDNVDSAVIINMTRTDTTDGAGSLIFEADSGNASLTIDSGATGNVTFNSPGARVMQLNSVLDVTHNGTGILDLGSATITGSNGISFNGSGTIDFNNGSGHTYTGTNTFNGGTVRYINQNSFGNANNAMVFNGGTLEMNHTSASAIDSTRATTINAGGATIAVTNDTTLVYNAAITGTGALTKTGVGALELENAANAWTGGLNINGGTVRAVAINRIGGSSQDITFDGGTLHVSAPGDRTFNPKSATLNAGGGTILNNGMTLNWQTGFTGTGGLTKDGTGTLFLDVANGANTYTGATTITGGGTISMVSEGKLPTGGDIVFDNGTLKLDVAGARTFGNRGATTLGAGGGAMEVITGGTLTYEGAIGGAGNFSKTGDGTLELGAVNTYTGNTDVAAGTLDIVGGGSLLFVIGANGVNNQIDGAGNLLFTNGSFDFDLSGAAGVGSWSIIGSSLLANTTFTNFSVDGFTDEGSGIWTSGDYTFSESTGTLTAVPEPGTFALIGGLLALGAVLVRRRAR